MSELLVDISWLGASAFARAVRSWTCGSGRPIDQQAEQLGAAVVAARVHEHFARANAAALRTAGDNEGSVEELLPRPNVSMHEGGTIARIPEGDYR